MQKLITVSVDTKQLLQSPTNPFTVNEVDGVNELLEQGWEIEQLEFLKGGDGTILFLAILNDDAMFDEDDDEFDRDFGFDDDDDDEDDDDEEDDRNKIKEMKKV